MKTSRPGDGRNLLHERASAGLIIAESTTPSPSGHCYVHQPGIYTKTQIDAWRKVTNSVHKAGGRISCSSTTAAGRVALTTQPTGGEIIGPSPIAMNGTRYTDQLGEAPPPAPRAMTLDDIKQVVADFGKAARNAVDAGFDGIELHCSTGYLMNSFSIRVQIIALTLTAARSRTGRDSSSSCR